MSDNSTYELYSPGRIYALTRAIRLIFKYGDGVLSPRELVMAILDEGAFGGMVPIKDALRLGLNHKLIDIQDDRLSLTEACHAGLKSTESGTLHSAGLMRMIVDSIVRRNRFHWLVFFGEDIEVFKTAIPGIWIDLLGAAQLLDFDDPLVAEWWKDILLHFHEYDDKRKKKIGDVGEKLTVEYEKRRLVGDGFANAHLYVKWVSRFSDSYGYDVASIRGRTLARGFEPKEHIRIEVKASESQNIEAFRFMVSRNEWDTAQDMVSTYFFYCWADVSLHGSSDGNGPFVVPSGSLADLLPTDSNAMAQWSECRVTIDLAEFALSLDVK